LKTIFRSAGTVTAQLSPEFMDTYNNDRIVHASNMILAFYRNRGFVKAVIQPPEFDLGPTGSATMKLVLKITENNLYQLGTVKVTGATVLRDTVVASMLSLHPGPWQTSPRSMRNPCRPRGLFGPGISRRRD
jgi:outer membrane protein assembly factor BamA